MLPLPSTTGGPLLSALVLVNGTAFNVSIVTMNRTQLVFTSPVIPTSTSGLYQTAAQPVALLLQAHAPAALDTSTSTSLLYSSPVTSLSLPHSGPVVGDTVLTLTGTVPRAYTPQLQIGSGNAAVTVACTGMPDGATALWFTAVTCVTPPLPALGTLPLALSVDDARHIPVMYTVVSGGLLSYPVFNITTMAPRNVYLHQPSQLVVVGRNFTPTGEAVCALGDTAVNATVILPAFSSATRYSVTNTGAGTALAYDLVLSLNTTGLPCERAVRAVMIVDPSSVGDTSGSDVGADPGVDGTLPLWIDTAAGSCNKSAATTVRIAVGDIPPGATRTVLVLMGPTSSRVTMPLPLNGTDYFPYYDAFTSVNRDVWLPPSATLHGATFSWTTSSSGLRLVGPWPSTLVNSSSPAFTFLPAVFTGTEMYFRLAADAPSQCGNPYIAVRPAAGVTVALAWSCGTVCLATQCAVCPLSPTPTDVVVTVTSVGNASSTMVVNVSIPACSVALSTTVGLSTVVQSVHVGIGSSASTAVGVTFRRMFLRPYSSAGVTVSRQSLDAATSVLVCDVPLYDSAAVSGLGSYTLSLSQNSQNYEELDAPGFGTTLAPVVKPGQVSVVCAFLCPEDKVPLLHAHVHVLISSA